MPENQQKPTFKGQSTNLSLEEAIKDAISKDPRNVPGTDLFDYTLVETNVQFGGFVQSFTLFVTLRRDTVEGSVSLHKEGGGGGGEMSRG